MASVLLLVAGCGDGTAPRSSTPAVSLRIEPNRVSVTTLGGTVRFSARLTDDAGATYTPEGPVTYQVRDAAVATVDPTGRLVGGPRSGRTYVVATTRFRGATLTDSAEVFALAPDGG